MVMNQRIRCDGFRSTESHTHLPDYCNHLRQALRIIHLLRPLILTPATAFASQISSTQSLILSLPLKHPTSPSPIPSTIPLHLISLLYYFPSPFITEMAAAVSAAVSLPSSKSTSLASRTSIISPEKVCFNKVHFLPELVHAFSDRKIGLS